MSDISFILIDPPKRQLNNESQTSLTEEWRRAFAEHLQPKDLERFSFLESRLNQLQAARVTFDCIVSPANSYGIMDGGSVSDHSCVPRQVTLTLYSGLISIYRWLSPHQRTSMLLLASSRPLSGIAIMASHHQVHVSLSQVSHQTISLARLSRSALRCATQRN